MTLATLFVAVCASAQVYIGGGFSVARFDRQGNAKAHESWNG